jgi:NAD+ synthase
MTTQFNKKALDLDAASETKRIVTHLQRDVNGVMGRRGAVVGVSGGVDSAVVLALAVRAFGTEKVRAVLMPDKDSDPLSETLGREVSLRYGVEPVLEDITAALDGFGAYRRRDDAIRRHVPEYDAALGFKVKVVLPPDLLDGGSLNVFSVVVLRPDGSRVSKMLPGTDFLEIMAASNFKQRARMSVLYYHAELTRFAVLGTANRNEHGQGFFVKHGDGGVDIHVLRHLYKTQIYQVGRYLGVPSAILERPPTTDTYSAPSTQEEFFFRLPFEVLDPLMNAFASGISAAETAAGMGLTEIQVVRVYADLRRRMHGSDYLRLAPVEILPATPLEKTEEHEYRRNNS